ncbi:16S rRNA (cytosine(967)-C(5))-methyltransferase RsmB [Loigolactobacillus backii]|uniref:16S rRNA (cytosine(967)-C(5))-methyltransferase n=1 Tax=Loigolactobacillus backii TaxID=375175 RepID=A0A192H469_9LACO|nr:16S rRNA (cytosine(967)-C(5))-methyltransferase RsmB [Loigolactobacillus backii]ANK59373.1 16S rRNA (cytosine(967)-C(5))-methyltransferase [Loigolactobacillus backii]ANK63048.1 16S rRNA (cytosine(967)-C(5))-methyltransferase [Loigolactobacillus backii]ANK64366.1 16S rRNA (cytosine(967)-C(5))-methyltransferase [Loigolactobacillus backii]ANK69944.1 16S rRNA (cytosine(967)-C(5))-methyltransferase [Loigolactobacillus backii]MDA5388322.1 16S rRNA (cytosine(967)-C(5))-methyltransferase RsmB [Loig
MANKLKQTPRYLAVDILERVEKEGSYANIALDQVLDRVRLNSSDAGLLTNIVYGVIQHRLTLDYWLAPFIKKPQQLEHWVRQVLRLSVYQMTYLDKIPNRAIFYEATEIAKNRGNQGTAGLVTAILRNIQRTGLRDLTEIADADEQMSIKYSLPVWLVKKLQTELGQAKTLAILEHINEPPTASIRVNTRVTNAEKLQTELAEVDLQVEPSHLTPVGLVSQGGFFAGTAAFEAGQYTVQDESSMLVAASMQLKPNQQVLDACAAPGGKTTHIATYLNAGAGGHVTALDLHANKVRLIEENANRLHVSDVVSAQAMDARDVHSKFADEQFDRILVDAPCSGLGLLRRKPEIKYARSEADLQNLKKIQLAILNSVAKKVKIGGILTYSTCTIVDEENQQVIEKFRQQHPEFDLIPVKTDYDLTVETEPYMKLYPDDYRTDGFFICCLQRKTR